jgi:hypothetical protein
MSLKSFIITEETKANHSERFLLYLDRYHTQVFLELRKTLADAWGKKIRELEGKHPLSAEASQEAILRNPQATTQLVLATSPEKLSSPRSREPLEVCPSVKVPLAYSKEERELITRQLISAAKEAFTETLEAWSEIFKYEKKGQLHPAFKLVEDHDELRAQLIVNGLGAEAYKTLYAVHVEYGKPSSKVKDYDRVYLTSPIKLH